MPPVQAASPFLEELMEAKKLQVTELFGPWDTEDEGRIAVAHLRPLLLSVFPSPTVTTTAGGPLLPHAAAATVPSPLAAAAGLLSLARVKKAYETVTGRPFSPPSSKSSPPAAAAAAAIPQRHLRAPGPVPMGPTLNEVHGIIEALSGSGGGGADGMTSMSTSHPPAQALASEQSRWRAQEERAAEKEKRMAAESGSLPRSRRVPSKSPLSPPTPAVIAPASWPRSSDASRAPALDPRVVFLYGSMEAIHRAFCVAACAPGEAMPATLPLDTAHLQRLAAHVQSRPLRHGEARALQELFASAQGDSTCLTCDAFVAMLCSM